MSSCGSLTAQTFASRDASTHLVAQSRDPELHDGSPSHLAQQILVVMLVGQFFPSYNGPLESHPPRVSLPQWLLIPRSFRQIAIQLFASQPRQLRFPANRKVSDVPLPRESIVAPLNLAHPPQVEPEVALGNEVAEDKLL